MTTIKSVFEHSPQTLLVEPGKREGETYLRVNHGKTPYGDAMVATADLLAALDAVPAEKARQAVEDERAHCKEIQAELVKKLAAQRDQARTHRVAAWDAGYAAALLDIGNEFEPGTTNPYLLRGEDGGL